jgi:membrane protein DedA with SNARE-associated domain
VLYLLIGVTSLAEGILPPVPGDVAAAFLAFLAARAGGLWLPTTIAVCTGSVAGNCVVWWVGRRYGTEWIAHQMARFKLARSEEKLATAEHRIEDAYERYGWVALFVSRFIPGVRAMAPAAAGALRVPLWETIAVLYAASLLWYGAVTWIAFKVGTDWESVRAALATFARDAGIAGTALGVVLAAVVFVIWRRRRREGG